MSYIRTLEILTSQYRANGALEEKSVTHEDGLKTEEKGISTLLIKMHLPLTKTPENKTWK